MEKPKIVYVVKLPRPGAGGVNKKINYSVTMWQRGYIRNRLEQKCLEHSVELVEVLGKDISNECSNCGALISDTLISDTLKNRKSGLFICGNCGSSLDEKINTARNVLKRGREGRIVR